MKTAIMLIIMSLTAVILDGKKAKVTCLIGLNLGPDYCVLKLEEPDEKGCTIIEAKKSLFNYLTQG
jgi:hypothetical protein